MSDERLQQSPVGQRGPQQLVYSPPIAGMGGSQALRDYQVVPL